MPLPPFSVSFSKRLLLALVCGGLFGSVVLAAEDEIPALRPGPSPSPTPDSLETPDPIVPQVNEAERLEATDEGQIYRETYRPILLPVFDDLMRMCRIHGKPPYSFDLVFVVAADGKISEVLVSRFQPVGACFGPRLRTMTLPPPPKAGWLIHYQMRVR